MKAQDFGSLHMQLVCRRTLPLAGKRAIIIIIIMKCSANGLVALAQSKADGFLQGLAVPGLLQMHRGRPQSAL